MYNQVKSSFQKHIDFIILDIICMEISFFIAYYIRHNNLLLLDYSKYRIALIIILFANVIACYMFNSMQDVLKRKKQLEFYATVKQVVFVEIVLVFFLFATKTSEDFSRNVIIAFPIIYLIFSFIVRLLYKSILKKILKNKSDRNLVIICDEDKKEKVKKRFNDIVNDYRIVKICSYGEKTIIDFILREHVDEVLCLGKPNENLVSKIIEMGVVLHIEADDIGGVLSGNNKVFIENITDIPVMTCTLNTISSFQFFIKWLMDFFAGIVGLIITIILVVMVGPIIKIKSPGPIFFAQERVGKGGKIFKMFKFRSMIVNADAKKKELMSENSIKGGMMFKMDDDPRIIPGIGKFIRKTSIDEFPQFFNILLGDMSLVGTRPPTKDEWEKYDLHHRARLAIKPGITGLWQVSGRSDIKNFEDVVKLDTEYIKNYSLWMDMSIIWKTVKLVFTGKGAK